MIKEYHNNKDNIHEYFTTKSKENFNLSSTELTILGLNIAAFMVIFLFQILFLIAAIFLLVKHWSKINIWIKIISLVLLIVFPMPLFVILLIAGNLWYINGKSLSSKKLIE